MHRLLDISARLVITTSKVLPTNALHNQLLFLVYRIFSSPCQNSALHKNKMPNPGCQRSFFPCEEGNYAAKPRGATVDLESLSLLSDLEKTITLAPRVKIHMNDCCIRFPLLVLGIVITKTQSYINKRTPSMS